MDENILKILDGIEKVREIVAGDPKIQKYRGLFYLIKTTDTDRWLLNGGYDRGICMGVIHSQTYLELRTAAVETCRLLPFPSDQELAMIIFCGVMATEPQASMEQMIESWIKAATKRLPGV